MAISLESSCSTPRGKMEDMVVTRPTGEGPLGGPLAALSVSMLLSSLGAGIANVALPAIAKAFDATFQATQWVVLAYLLAITTLVVGVGRLSDLADRRRLLLAGVALFTLAAGMCGAAPSLGVLVFARAAQGLGAATMMALTMAMVGERVPPSRLGSAMGLLGTMSAVGTALGPALGGALISGFGWRAIFYVSVPVGVVAFGLAHRFLPADNRNTAGNPKAFDLAGTALLALSLAAYALAMTIGRGHFGPLNGALLISAGLGVALFLVVEARSASPLVQLAMFRSPGLCAGLVIGAAVSTVMMATMVVGPLYLTGALGLAMAPAGLVLSLGPVTVALTGVPAGRLTDRFGAHRMSMTGLFAIAAGSLALSLAPMRWGLPGFVASLVIMTAGYALVQTANNSAVLSGVEAGQRGVISGMLNLARNLGLITGASAMGAVFTVASGVTEIAVAQPANVAIGMRATFAVAAALIGVALIIARGSRPRAER